MSADVTTNDVLTRQARQWLLLINSGEITETQRLECGQWLARDSANLAEYRRLESLWSEFDLVADDVLAAYADELEPVECEPEVVQRRAPWLAAAAIAMLMLFGGVSYQSMFGTEAMPEVVVFTSPIAEVREITLDDGSYIDLGPGSSLTVAYGPEKRSIRLSQGEAYFRVAKDPERPFVVEAKSGSARAVGTEFEVYMGAKNVSVTVHEGEVEVSTQRSINGRQTYQQIALTTGRRASYSASGRMLAPSTVDLELSSTWRHGKLVFNNKPLRDVVSDLNRYSEQMVVISDPRLDNIEVNGVFQLGETEAVLRAIEGSLPARVVHTAGRIELQHAQGAEG